MREVQINYLAVFVSALVPIVIGAFWYSPLLFAKVWKKAHGHSEERIARIRQAAGRTTLISFVCYAVIALVISILISYAGASTALQGAGLGALVWVGFFATVGMTAHLFSEKRLATYLLDIGFQLTYVVAMAVILTVWR